MKKHPILLFAACLVAVLSANAQTIIKGDMNDDNQVDVSDVTAVVDCILTGNVQTMDVSVPPYKVDNAGIVGTWMKSAKESITFGADGTTDYAGAATYKYMPNVGRVLFYNAAGVYVNALNVMEATADYLILCANNYAEGTYWLSESAQRFVDLGLPGGVLWATCNVGADKPYEHGDYFAWGDVQGYKGGHTNFSWATCPFWTSGNSFSNVKFSKYVTKSTNGTIDNLTTLEPVDDVATVQWGGGWRMPTKVEWDDLHNSTYCTWTWYDKGNIEFNNTSGYKVTSVANGNYIFLPATAYRDGTNLYVGSGYYWSSSLYESEPGRAWYCYFDSHEHFADFDDRSLGTNIRPVACPK